MKFCPWTPEDNEIIARFSWARGRDGADAELRIRKWGIAYVLTQDREYEAMLARMRNRTPRLKE